MTISIPDRSLFAMARYIESFATDSGGWEFPSEQSADYEKLCLVPSCCVVSTAGSLPHSAIHFTAKNEEAKSLYVSSIVLLSISHLSIEEYNKILASFISKIRDHAKKNCVPIKIKMSKAVIRFDDVITGEIARKFWKNFVGNYPLSGHPLDIERLDKFICAVSRYARKSFDLEAFQALLTEDLGWSLDEASWCRQRVEIGLEVLKVEKNF